MADLERVYLNREGAQMAEICKGAVRQAIANVHVGETPPAANEELVAAYQSLERARALFEEAAAEAMR